METGERIGRWEELAVVEEPPAASAELLAALPAEVRRRLGERLLVVVRTAVAGELTRFFGEDLGQERMALLSGRVFRLSDAEPLSEAERVSKDRWLVLVEGAVPVRATRATPVHVAMSPASWPELWSVLEGQRLVLEGQRLDPNCAAETMIVGWAHSHPGLGAFFSGEDRRTQAQWFRQPWHIGLVLDPVSGDLAGFAGALAEPVSLRVE